MIWRVAMLACGVWWLLLGTGCPENHRKGGAFDRAAAKDMKEQYLPGNEAFEEDDLHECSPGQVAHLQCKDDVCGWVCK